MDSRERLAFAEIKEDFRSLSGTLELGVASKVAGTKYIPAVKFNINLQYQFKNKESQNFCSLH